MQNDKQVRAIDYLSCNCAWFQFNFKKLIICFFGYISVNKAKAYVDKEMKTLQTQVGHHETRDHMKIYIT